MAENRNQLVNNMDYKKFLNRIISFRKYYVAIVLVCLIMAFLVNKYSEIKYQNYTTIYIPSQDNSGFLNSPNDIIQSFGFFDKQKIIENEVEILKSFSLVKKV